VRILTDDRRPLDLDGEIKALRPYPSRRSPTIRIFYEADHLLGHNHAACQGVVQFRSDCTS